jgi:hypothetical protein
LKAELQEMEDVIGGWPPDGEDIITTTAYDQAWQQYVTQVSNILYDMLTRILHYAVDCICDSLLVPCTECTDQEGVVLACLTVRDNKVVSICNVARTQVISGPAMRYWLHPLYWIFGMLVEWLCCEFDFGDILGKLTKLKLEDFSYWQDKTKGAAKVAPDYLSAAVQKLKKADIRKFMDAGKVSALGVIGRPASDVKAELEEKLGRTVTMKPADTADAAFDLRNLGSMTWFIDPDVEREKPEVEDIELVVDSANRVTAIRRVRKKTGDGR